MSYATIFSTYPVCNFLILCFMYWFTNSLHPSSSRIFDWHDSFAADNDEQMNSSSTSLNDRTSVKRSLLQALIFSLIKHSATTLIKSNPLTPHAGGARRAGGCPRHPRWKGLNWTLRWSIRNPSLHDCTKPSAVFYCFLLGAYFWGWLAVLLCWVVNFCLI